jgi:sigma-B regulation protein RsbU (phosphoserine phosphatase)
MVILLLLTLGASIGFYVAGRLARKRRRIMERLQDEREEIVSEERRLFTFLHALGASISTDNRESTLQRLIVEGAMKVTGSKGGAFYAYDDGRQLLVPRFYSDECSPVIDLTEKVVAQDRIIPGSLLSTMRWQAVAANAGVLGNVFTSQQSEHINNLATHERLGSIASVHQEGITVMAGPVSSGERKLGVLVMTANLNERTFSQNDFEVFSSLVEQSAYALANAKAHQEMQSKQQLEAELKTAGDVQRILLPDRAPALDGYVFAGRNLPARILSGDFYDYLELDGTHFGAVIADVSGKGFPAALIAATSRSALQAHAKTRLSPTAVLSAVNRQICPDIRQDMFVSMIYLVIESGSPQVTLSRAGHPEPLVWRKRTGIVEVIQSPGLGVGIDDGDVFDRVTKDTTLTMESGDVMLLYTDGISEAEDKDGDLFDEDRIKQSLAASAHLGATVVVDHLLDALNTFTGGKAPHDDVTVITIQKT